MQTRSDRSVVSKTCDLRQASGAPSPGSTRTFPSQRRSQRVIEPGRYEARQFCAVGPRPAPAEATMSDNGAASLGSSLASMAPGIPHGVRRMKWCVGTKFSVQALGLRALLTSGRTWPSRRTRRTSEPLPPPTARDDHPQPRRLGARLPSISPVAASELILSQSHLAKHAPMISIVRASRRRRGFRSRRALARVSAMATRGSW